MKKIIALLLVLSMALCFCACESDGTVDPTKSDFKTFVAGFGRADVTPYAPVHLGSYQNAMDRLSTCVRDHFYALTTAMTDTEGNTLLIIVTDLSWGHMNQLELIRPKIQEQFGIPAEHVMLGGTHNHNGPEWMNEGYAEPENVIYFEKWVKGVMESVEMALADRKPAKLHIGRTETENLGFVRRYFREDGNLIGGGHADTYVASDSPIVRHETEGDEEVQLVKITREGGKDILIGQWQNHGCHDGNTTMASTDWIGYTREKVMAEVDCEFMYLQGAAGNMATESWLENEYPEKKSTQQVGEEVAQVIVDFCNNEAFTTVDSGTIRVKQVQYTDTNPSGRSEWTAEMNSVAIGDLSLITLPVELFAESGIEIKERTPFEMTLIMGYANGICGYVGTKLAFETGGYGVVDGRGNENSAEKMVNTYIDSLTEIHD